MGAKKKQKPWQDLWDVAEGALEQGAQGKTIRVSNKQDPNVVGVLKELKNNKDEQARRRMRVEVVALETLGVAGLKVPRVIEHNTEDFEDLSAVLYFVMDFIPGKTLTTEINERGPLTFDQAASMCLDLCNTILSAHGQGIIHRDLKPDNIIVRDFTACDLVIVDYGLSFNHGNDLSATEIGDQIRNRFLALPETNTPSGDLRDRRSDVTALGGLLYYLVTGHYPGHLRDGEGLPPHRRPRFSVSNRLNMDPRLPALNALFDRAFENALNDRFQTTQELVGRIEHVRSGSAGAQVDLGEAMEKLAEQAQSRSRRSKVAAIVGKINDVLTNISRSLNIAKIQKSSGFIVQITGTSPTIPTLPVGVDQTDLSMAIRVKLPPHQLAHQANFSIGLQGNQCVLFRCLSRDAGPATPQRHRFSFGQWLEILYFNPDSKPGVNELHQIAEEGLKAATAALVADLNE